MKMGEKEVWNKGRVEIGIRWIEKREGNKRVRERHGRENRRNKVRREEIQQCI